MALHFWDLLIENKWNKLQPGLAVSWKPLDDKTWEFKLREGVKWQDGTPFTADDLIYSYTRARAVPGSVATYAGYLRTIDSMSAKDPLTPIVKTKAPNPDLPLNLASVHVVSKHVGESPAPRTTTRARPWSAPAPTVRVLHPGDRVVMARNDGYWGDKQIWDQVNYRYINNAAARTAALLAGDVDVIDKVSVSDLAAAKAPNVSVHPYDGLRVMLLQPSFNPASSPYITDNAGKLLDKNPLLDVRAPGAEPGHQPQGHRRPHPAGRRHRGQPVDAQGHFRLQPRRQATFPTTWPRPRSCWPRRAFPTASLTMHVLNDRYPQGPETAQAVAQF